MKKFLLLLALCCSMLLIFGCSQNGDFTTSPDQGAAIVLVERPQFVDTRPPAVIEAHTLKTDLSHYLYKKPPPPPPDTGGGEDPNPNPAHKYAYIVGISDYEGTANDLQFCDEDAQEMKSMLQGEGFTIRMDVDQNASADNIVAGLQWLIDNASPGDEVAFCYSGHGMKSSEGSAIISADLYYIPHGYVMSYFNAVNCTKKLMTLDACVIGDFHGDVESGTVMATASDRSNSYDAPDLQNGAWTYFFLEAVNDQNMVFAEDVATYAEAEMRAWAKPYHLRVSPKHTDAYTGMFDM